MFLISYIFDACHNHAFFFHVIVPIIFCGTFKITIMLCHFIHFPAITKPYFHLQIRQKIIYEDHMLWNVHICIIPDSVLVVISHMLCTTFTYLYNFISAISFKVISHSFLVISETAVIVCADNL